MFNNKNIYKFDAATWGWMRLALQNLFQFKSLATAFLVDASLFQMHC